MSVAIKMCKLNNTDILGETPFMEKPHHQKEYNLVLISNVEYINTTFPFNLASF